MASAAKERARNFVQILWVPKPGDRILLRRNKKYQRGIVDSEFNGMYLTSCIPGEFMRSTQLFFVPRQVDYSVLLWTMHADRQIELLSCPSEDRTGTGRPQFMMTRRFRREEAERDTLVHLQGSAVEVLSGLLQMRVSDAAFNDYINALVLRPVPKALAN